MFIKHTLVLLILLLGLASFSSCEKDEKEEDVLKTCCEVAPLQIELGDAKLYLPNTFTPNGDGINDVFYPHTNSEVSLVQSFQIFSNTGQLLFSRTAMEANNPSLGWDGTDADGDPVEGVFDYNITITNLQQDVGLYHGEICCRYSINYPIPCVQHEQKCAWPIQHDGEGQFDPTFASGENCE